MTVNVTWFPMAPYFMETKDPGNNKYKPQRHAGRDYIILQEIAQALNFSSNILPYKELDHVRSTSTALLTSNNNYVKFCILPQGNFLYTTGLGAPRNPAGIYSSL